MSDAMLKIQGVSHWFGNTKVLHELDLEIQAGEIVSLVGPSGCGKSTLLRAIVGTHPPRKGQILVNVNGQMLPVRKPSRDIGIVYQKYSLFPFLTALGNVMFGPMLDQTTIWERYLTPWKWWKLRQKVKREAISVLTQLGLGDAIDRYPPQMSGGMQQRTAIAQAIIMKPRILLLDEPFGALDEATRERQQRMILELSLANREAKDRGEQPPYTVLIVTHELNEAIYVGDRVVGLSQYWNWQSDGHETCPGATFVYNEPCPTYKPSDPKDHADFVRQKDNIINRVFEPEVREAHEALLAVESKM